MIVYVENIVSRFDEKIRNYDDIKTYHCVIDGVDYGSIKAEMIPARAIVVQARVFNDFKNAEKDESGHYKWDTVRKTKYLAGAPCEIERISK